jgi:hypothetical protein
MMMGMNEEKRAYFNAFVGRGDQVINISSEEKKKNEKHR